MNLWQDLLLLKPRCGRRSLSSFLHLEEFRRVTDGTRTRDLLSATIFRCAIYKGSLSGNFDVGDGER
jgi:hypothetical protein